MILFAKIFLKHVKATSFFQILQFNQGLPPGSASAKPNISIISVTPKLAVI